MLSQTFPLPKPVTRLRDMIKIDSKSMQTKCCTALVFSKHLLTFPLSVCTVA